MKLIRRLIIVLAILVALIVGAMYVFPKQATSLALQLQHSASDLDHKSIRLPNGSIFHYLEGGDDDAPVLVLLHGFSANKDHFSKVAMGLKSHFHLIIPDQVGFGESTRVIGGDYRYDAQAKRLHELLNGLGITGAINIGGSSMGGAISIAYAAKYPNQVTSVWLLDSGGVSSAPQSEVLKRYHATGKHDLIAHDFAGFLRSYHLAMSNPPFVPTPILKVMSQENINNAPLLNHIIAQILSDPIEARAATIKVPTLIVYGAEDKLLSPAAGDILVKLIPNSKLIIMSGLGHLPMLEAPFKVAKDYVAFSRAVGIIK